MGWGFYLWALFLGSAHGFWNAVFFIFILPILLLPILALIHDLWFYYWEIVRPGTRTEEELAWWRRELFYIDWKAKKSKKKKKESETPKEDE